MSTMDLLALANGIESARFGLDAEHSPYMVGSAARWWLLGWRRMRKIMKSETETENKEAKR